MYQGVKLFITSTCIIFVALINLVCGVECVLAVKFFSACDLSDWAITKLD